MSRFKPWLLAIILLLAVALVVAVKLEVWPFDPAAYVSVIKIGLVEELTGEMAAVGQSGRQAAELAVQEINLAGGLQLSGREYPVKLIVKDNGSNEEQTRQAVRGLIKNDGVNIIIGPNASHYALAAAEVAEELRTPLLAPWSTNPQTTLDSKGFPKKYIFRAAFLDSFQGQALAQFAGEVLKAKTAAIFYDAGAEVLKGQAEFFRRSFVRDGGQIVADESYQAGSSDFAAQLQKIKTANAEVIFLPSYYQEAALIIKQAKAMGLTAPFLGSDGWVGPELLSRCGAACEGDYLSAHYAADSTSPVTQKFVAAYRAAYGATPDDVAALTYDSFGLLQAAVATIKNPGRGAIRGALSGLTDYNGVTGKISFTKNSGDPVKGAVILQIKGGQLIWFAELQPAVSN
ncbi:MAG: ABC transporter substrate-binding protein [Patescibacteria group bacterium]|jgi:branched-chain amino acid transport system substrate-binding protein